MHGEPDADIQEPGYRSPDKGYRIAARGHLITWARTEIDLQSLAVHFEQKLGSTYQYFVICRELHQDGAPHGHLYVYYHTKKAIKDARVFYSIPGGAAVHIRDTDSPKGSAKYVKKGGNFIERGSLPKDKVTREQMGRELQVAVIKKGAKGVRDVAINYPQLTIGFSNVLRDALAFSLASAVSAETDTVRGIWIWGPPGVGKSRLVRTYAPNEALFIKPQNKWWDGYSLQEFVLIDDFDKSGTCLAHHLKIWADRYSINGEVKGGTTPLLYRVLFITSNYSIDQLFNRDEDLDLNQAIARRFSSHHIASRATYDADLASITEDIEQIEIISGGRRLPDTEEAIHDDAREADPI